MYFFYFIIFSIVIIVSISFQEWKLEKIYTQSIENEALTSSEKIQIEFTYQVAKSKYKTARIVLFHLLLFITILIVQGEYF